MDILDIVDMQAQCDHEWTSWFPQPGSDAFECRVCRRCGDMDGQAVPEERRGETLQ